ncbi:hypothetical protein HCC27_08870 [Streptococcus suis]|nr:hypothetical protein [Streptococcus suis]HEL1569412.1 hypothetical protein [Streptococcus suis]HEL2311881.1 hypothetical protein [Streptococcus suis]HEL2640570.1 hypothetical protein [Streptococcus suis]HEL2655633.1 hypothetical protein [Streptococcus suis]
MNKLEEVRKYFIENPQSTMIDCARETGLDYDTVKTYVWRDTNRGVLSKDSDGRICYAYEFPEKATDTPAKQVAWAMVEILQDRAKSAIDDEMLLRFSKEIRLYIPELK